MYKAWTLLLNRHEPSSAVDVSELYQKLTSAAQNGRPMGEHVQQCMTWQNRLKALGAEQPNEIFVQRLREVDDTDMFIRASLVSMSRHARPVHDMSSRRPGRPRGFPPW